MTTSGGSRARVGALLLLVFAAGAAAGVAADRLGVLPEAARASEEAREHPDRRGGPEATPRRGQATIEKFADELGLTATQRTEIEAVLDRFRAEVRGMWGEFRPRYKQLVDSARADIEGILTEEQAAQYRRLLERRHGDDDHDDRRRSSGGDRGGR